MTGYDQLILRYFARDEHDRAWLTRVAKQADAAMSQKGEIDFREFPDAPGKRLAVGQTLIIAVRRAPYMPLAMLGAACLYIGMAVFWIVAELR
ncbi:MAG TPA: hypothetical protein VF292_08560 [Rhodanobacteraceae bacterium]